MTEISSDVIRGYNDTIILYLLLKEPSYVIKETTLYSAFTRMQKNGYIVSFYGDETGGKRRTYYRITEKGRAYYYEKCKEWVLTKDVIEKFISREECGNGDN